jgi:hypothetical protein
MWRATTAASTTATTPSTANTTTSGVCPVPRTAPTPATPQVTPNSASPSRSRSGLRACIGSSPLRLIGRHLPRTATYVQYTAVRGGVRGGHGGGMIRA